MQRKSFIKVHHGRYLNTTVTLYGVNPLQWNHRRKGLWWDTKWKDDVKAHMQVATPVYADYHPDLSLQYVAYPITVQGHLEHLCVWISPDGCPTEVRFNRV